MLSIRYWAFASVWFTISATAGLLIIAGIPVTLSSNVNLLIVLFIFAGVSVLFYGPEGTRPITRAIQGIECLGLMLAGVAAGGVAQYPIASFSLGWTDQMLASWDDAFGFDWRAIYEWLKGSDLVDFVLLRAYLSIFLQPVLLIIALASFGHINRAYRFIFATMITLTITDASLLFFPSKGAAVYFLGDTGLLPTSAFSQANVIGALQARTFEAIPLPGLNGLISFPSFHAAACVLFTWASWPLRAFRVFAIVINITMLIATPIFGGHYIIDIIGGFIVAGLSIYTSEMLPTILARRTKPLTWNTGILTPSNEGLGDV